MKKLLFILLVIGITLVSGCGLIQKQEVVCNKPYIQVGTDCCLDNDDNAICDKDEIIKQEKIEEEVDVEEIETISPEEAMKSAVMFICRGYREQYTIYGSGFYVNENEIVTNQHVFYSWMDECDPYKRAIRNKYGKEILQVELVEGEDKTNLELIGYDWDYDLALFKLPNSKSSNYLNFGNSDSLDIGERVYALGSPNELEFTTTSGVISAKNRAGLNNEDLKGYLQTDTPLNKGNSGGPLINEEGLVMGISTFGYAPWYAEGLYFAIESKKAEELIQNIRHIYEMTGGVLDTTIQHQPNEIVEAYANFDIDWKLNAEEWTEKFVFKEVNVNLENKDDKLHNICFSFEMLRGASVEVGKKTLDTKATIEAGKKEQINVPVFIIQEGRGNYYFEFDVFDCDTGDVYNTAGQATTKLTTNFDRFYRYKG